MNRFRATAHLVLVLPTAVVVLAGAPSCSSKALAPLDSACALNSDCDSPLVCVFAQCHQQCKLASDCPGDERCVSTGSDAGAGNVCQLPQESVCTSAGACAGDLVCGTDGQCRSPCQPQTGCPSGQSCSTLAGASACFDALNPVDRGVIGGPDAGSAVEKPDATAGGGPNDGAAGADGSTQTSADVSVDAPWTPTTDAGPIPFHPSNFDPVGVPMDAGGDAGLWASALDVDVAAPCSTANANCLNAVPVTIAQNDVGGTLANLYVLKSLTIDDVASVTLAGPRPVILAVLTTVNIQGRLLVSAGGYSAATNPGPGAGALGPVGGQYPEAGGGSYCGIGGKGVSIVPGAPGPSYGVATLTPLLGGSAGGGNNGVGGAGGGAVQIVAGTSITIAPFGAINAGGYGGGGNSPSAGGSGGAILLEAPAVTVLGNVAANGGGGDGETNLVGGNGAADDIPAAGGGAGFDGGTNGFGGAGSAGMMVNGSDGAEGGCTTCGSGSGSGGGGAGRIRINGGVVTISGIVSPALATPCATQGTIH